MTPAEARNALRIAEEVHAGKRSFPPEILRIQEEVRAARRRALLFAEMFGIADEGLIRRAVELMLEKDRLYTEWLMSES